ncbi:baseplate assembly protein [Edwardsiella ictaluri]|uniref:Baseplate J-like protein n=1 Tax=Edwardsiella ictaluri (strain 93-146) TaxID=634503 RepID=C5BEP1_EDWI9|nr:baseplate assembly protein [Edwardsiella ictaluri]ACR70282.1 baseplate J-like protein [Edwardsiella ictaluri 93-146]AVZ82851.1 baseplate assembly protein [Edwardsiella ictaluri]EKS7762481.1 baseplate assembly protein [Edwardsiella ictaluri]EKS7770431.1 baseplate assembly protein [Edwardsiella ictaluri]EKS7773573.1 baseplate assembly protein [Edwardsiella ictaluri]
MSALTDLSQLPVPDTVETLDFETLFTARKQRFISLYPVEQRAEVARTLNYESEPIVKLLQENAYLEMALRVRINEAAVANMLAHASRRDLDNLTANFKVFRLLISPGDSTAVPPVEPVYESDDALRIRAQQAFEGLSVAGPTAAYEYHAHSADGRIADVSAISPHPCYVTVSVLSREGNGQASAELLAIVDDALNDIDIRPVGDRPTIQSAEIIPYQINALLYYYPGPEQEPIRQAAEQRLKNYINEQHRIGRDIRRSAIYAALHVTGVQRVELIAPDADVIISRTQASFCTEWQIAIGGNDE